VDRIQTSRGCDLRDVWMVSSFNKLENLILVSIRKVTVPPLLTLPASNCSHLVFQLVLVTE
jgi:hypothetical protein